MEIINMVEWWIKRYPEMETAFDEAESLRGDGNPVFISDVVSAWLNIALQEPKEGKIFLNEFNGFVSKFCNEDNWDLVHTILWNIFENMEKAEDRAIAWGLMPNGTLKKEFEKFLGFDKLFHKNKNS